MANNEKINLVGEVKKDILPNISEYGQKIIQIVKENKDKAVYKYPGNIYSWLGDPIIPDFGDLSNLDKPCVLTVDNYYTPDCGIDDYSETRLKELKFDKEIIIKALSQIVPDKTVMVTGKGRAAHTYEKGGYGYQKEEDKDRINIDNEVEVILKISLNKDANEVIFDFISKSLNPDDGFGINQRINLSK